MRARGATGLFALDALQLAVVALGAFLAVKFYFDTQDMQALMLLAILSGVVRWLGLMLILETALRPVLPAFRLIAMSDVAASRMRWLIGGSSFVGILSELHMTARNKLKSSQNCPSIIAACWMQATRW